MTAKTFDWTSGSPHLDDWLRDIVTERYPVCKEIRQMADLVMAACDDPDYLS